MESFSYDVTVADVQAFLKYELATTHARALRIQSFWSALALGVTTYVVLYAQSHSHLAAALVAVLLALLMLYAFPGVMRDINLKANRKRFANARDTALGHFDLVLGDRVVAKGIQSESNVAWDAVQSLGLTVSHAFLYLGPSKAIIIPIEQLDPATRQRLVGLLKAHVEK
jgi:hypothetical protein